MPLYEFLAKDLNGRTVKNQLNAPNEAALLSTLHDQGLVVISLSEFQNFLDSKNLFNKDHNIFTPRIKPFEMLLFVNQLSAMLDGGLHLTGALGSLSAEIDNKYFKKIIGQVKQDIISGSSFHEALTKHPKIFNKIFVNLINAAEVSGNLDKILAQYSIYLEKSLNLKRKIKGAMIYPVVILSFTFLMVAALLWKVVPIFEKTYADLGATLPLPTQILITLSQIFRENISISLIIFLGIILAFKALCTTYAGRMTVDRLILKLPVFGTLIRKVIMARFARTLSILFGSGLPILQCMDIVSHVSGNSLYEKAISTCKTTIQQGSNVTEALRKTQMFPELIMKMIDTGEQSGQLEKMLQKSADFYEQQVESTANNLAALLEPFLIITLGMIVGLVLITIYLPIFNLGRAFLK